MYILPVSNFFNNISFGKNKKPVYAIDSKGNYQRFNSGYEAAQKLGVTAPEISRSAANRFHKAGGYFIVNADEIESTDDDGKIVVKQKDIDRIVEYRTLKREIYAIDKNGNYLKFPSQSVASEELGVDRRAITNVVTGKRRIAKGYYFTLASKVESKDEHGNIFVDKDKVNKVIEDKPLHPIYAIDRQGNYIKFSNQKEAALELKTSRQRISQVLDSNNSTCAGYYFVPASKVESKDEDGKTIIDKAKIEEMLVKKAILTRSRSAGKIKRVYAIDSKGNYRKFASKKEASDKLGISVNTIAATVVGIQKTTQGLTFVNADQIEIKNKNREISIDTAKLEEITKERFPKTIFLE